MCGILAAFTNSTFIQEYANDALLKMSNRGPDNKGEWRDNGVYMGHLRLSILDLDIRSSQPMKSFCGRYVIIFNGEIYNYLDLRKDLPPDILDICYAKSSKALCLCQPW